MIAGAALDSGHPGCRCAGLHWVSALLPNRRKKWNLPRTYVSFRLFHREAGEQETIKQGTNVRGIAQDERPARLIVVDPSQELYRIGGSFAHRCDEARAFDRGLIDGDHSTVVQAEHFAAVL